MKTITLINGTNRPGNRTTTFLQAYADILRMKGVTPQILEMEQISGQFSLPEMYDYERPGIGVLVDKFITPAKVIVFFMPEYNAGIPGMLKLFIDGTNPAIWRNKSIALVGISSGRSGNLRGIDQVTSMMHYLQADVLHFKVPVSLIEKMRDREGRIFPDEFTVTAFERQIELLMDGLRT